MSKTTVRAAKKRVIEAAMRRFKELCASEANYVANMLKCNHTAAAKELVRACAALQRAPRRKRMRDELAKPMMNTILAHSLRAHYLSAIECNESSRRDRPICSCSLVDLGWHPSVGDAVEAWISHFLFEYARAEPLYAARQPSPIARDVALTEYQRNMLGSCENWLRSRSATAWAKEFKYTYLMLEYANFLNILAGTLSNDSVAAQATSDRGTSSAMSAEASDPNGTGTGPAPAAGHHVGKESVARVDGYGNGAPDAPSPAATDPALEELREDIDRVGEGPWEPSRNDDTVEARLHIAESDWERLRDMALRSLDLQQALARAQEQEMYAKRAASDAEAALARAQELLWELYEGIYGHRSAEGIDPFKTAVGGALEVVKAWRQRGVTSEGALRLANAYIQEVESWGIPSGFMPMGFEERHRQARTSALASAPSAKEGQPGEQSEERK